MRLILRHLTMGLFYRRTLVLFPSLVGTIIPIFWQLVNLYGTLPAVVLITGLFQALAVLLAAMLYPLLFFLLGFLQLYCIALAVMVMALVSWQLINLRINRRAGFKLLKLQFSTRTALLILGLLLGHRLLPIKLTPQTVFWDLHFKPHWAGQLSRLNQDELIAALKHDFEQAVSLCPDAIFFGCSPGSFKKILVRAGLSKAQFIMSETIIPREHARVFGLKRSFYFYVISSRPQLFTPLTH